MAQDRKIITVCGSMRYYNQMLAIANELTLEGNIVLLPFVLKIDDPGRDASLQELHRAKIDMSDEVYILAGWKYGESTGEEMRYAQGLGKKLFILRGFPCIGDQNAWEVVA